MVWDYVKYPILILFIGCLAIVTVNILNIERIIPIEQLIPTFVIASTVELCRQGAPYISEGEIPIPKWLSIIYGAYALLIGVAPGDPGPLTFMPLFTATLIYVVFKREVYHWGEVLFLGGSLTLSTTVLLNSIIFLWENEFITEQQAFAFSIFSGLLILIGLSILGLGVYSVQTTCLTYSTLGFFMLLTSGALIRQGQILSELGILQGWINVVSLIIVVMYMISGIGIIIYGIILQICKIIHQLR